MLDANVLNTLAVSKDHTEFIEISLDNPGEVRGEEPHPFQDPTDDRVVPHTPPSVPRPFEVSPPANPDPGMSILQDSVLGLRPNGIWFHHLILGMGVNYYVACNQEVLLHN
jgi:hypothetical protein